MRLVARPGGRTLALALALAGCACLAATSFAGPGVPLGEVAGGQLKEISGLAASRRHPGILWVHNDGGDGRLFAIRTNGVTAAVFELAADVTDLEDIAMGHRPGATSGPPYIYVGDIGDNEGQRRSIRLYRLPEPELPPGTSAKRPARVNEFETIVLRYPDGPHDAEALMCDPRTGDVFIATKQKRKSRCYVVSADRLKSGTTVTLMFLREISCPDVSAGDISPDGQHVLLRRENAAWLWSRGPADKVVTALGKAAQRVAVIGPPEEPNGEAIAWSADGRGYYTLSEGKRQPIYYFPLDAGSPTSPVP